MRSLPPRRFCRSKDRPFFQIHRPPERACPRGNGPRSAEHAGAVGHISSSGPETVSILRLKPLLFALMVALSTAAGPPTPRISSAHDPTDPRLRLHPDQVAIEYIAHACFRIHSPGGARLLIDPFASRVWIGYDFPPRLSADAVLITHPHYDHDAGVFIGRKAPWT